MSFKYFIILPVLIFSAIFVHGANDAPTVILSIAEQNGRLSVEANPKNGLDLGQISSEEKKTGTIELLLTKAVTDRQVIIGKFLAALILICIALAFTLP